MHPQTTSRDRTRLRTSALLGLCLLGLGNLNPGPAAAAGTDPLLAIDAVRAFASAGGAATIETSGRFSFEDLLQFPFPAGLIVASGSQWVRYGLDGVITQGTDPAIANGVTPAEVDVLLASGAPADPPAAIVRIAPAQISVALPASLTTGPATVLVYARLEGETFVSNSLGVTVP